MPIGQTELEKIDKAKPGEFIQILVPIPEIAACLNTLPKGKFALVQIIQCPYDMPTILLKNLEVPIPEKNSESVREIAKTLKNRGPNTGDS